MRKTVINFILVALLGVSIIFAGCASEHVTASLETKGTGPKGVVRADDPETIDLSWGSIQWLVSGADGTSDNMTLGRVVFKAGRENPPHYHPNCEEILYVVSGRLEHALPGGGTTVLSAGDSIVLPAGAKHYARNVGKKDAVVIVVFDSANRKTIGE